MCGWDGQDEQVSLGVTVRHVLQMYIHDEKRIPSPGFNRPFIREERVLLG